MNELLKALADHDRALDASPAVEARLRAALKRKRRIWPYFAAAAAAAAACAVLLIPHPPEQTMHIAVAAPPVVQVPQPKLRPGAPREPREVVTQFYALMEDEPFERGELWRVRVPASAMRSVGLPVAEEHLTDMVQADILVGEEGLARAIRFVSFERE
jgi:hypothetical protein